MCRFRERIGLESLAANLIIVECKYYDMRSGLDTRSLTRMKSALTILNPCQRLP
jgi:hypothetical protein